jgi:hypothetical protein
MMLDRESEVGSFEGHLHLTPIAEFQDNHTSEKTR